MNDDQENSASSQPMSSESAIESVEDGSADVTAITSTTTEAAFSGPLPPPAMLAQYEKILPGAAKQLFTMLERQSAHQQAIEKTAIEGDSKRETLGLWLGALVAVFLISCGTFLVYEGHDWAGATMIKTISQIPSPLMWEG